MTFRNKNLSSFSSEDPPPQKKIGDDVCSYEKSFYKNYIFYGMDCLYDYLRPTLYYIDFLPY